MANGPLTLFLIDLIRVQQGKETLENMRANHRKYAGANPKHLAGYAAMLGSLRGK